MTQFGNELSAPNLSVLSPLRAKRHWTVATASSGLNRQGLALLWEHFRGLGRSLPWACLLASSGVYLGATEEQPSHADGPVAPLVLPGASLAWSGRLALGFLATYSDSSTNPQLGPGRLDTADQHGEHQLRLRPVVSGELALRQEPGAVQWFVGLPLEESGVELGLRLPTSAGRLEVAGYFGFPEAVWSQPYTVEQGRDTTTSQQGGVRAQLADIAGSPYAITLEVRRVELRDDAAGDQWPSLARSAWLQSVTLAYAANLGAWRVQPRARLTRIDAEGEAETADCLSVGVAAQTQWQGLWWAMETDLGLSRYVGTHPIFASRRRDLHLRGMLSGTVPDVAGLSGVSLTGLAGLMATASPHDFYDETTWFTGLLVGYEF